MSARRRPITFGIAIVVLAAVVRIYGIGWGLPVVYEEATPLRVAWSMAGWGEPAPPDLNPHFFNYPSLTFYVQLAGQGVLYAALRAGGVVDSTLDYRVHYLLRKTPFVLLGRLISVLFALGTVWLTYRLGRRIGGYSVGVPAALLLTLNVFHISRSQMIEVDVPLTFFVTLALWFAVQLIEAPTKRNYLLAGLAMGLAASTKYTGALVLLPLAVAHLVAVASALPRKRRGVRRVLKNPLWLSFGLLLVTAVVAFAVTSPYVIIDSHSFAQHFSLEREHMRVGHFGLDTESTWGFYVHAVMGDALGWPLAVLVLLATGYLAVARRKPWALVLAAFVIPYFLILNSWAMMAERYLLPIVPAAIILGMAVVSDIVQSARLARLPVGVRSGIIVAVTLLAAIPSFAAMPDHLRRMLRDTRTEAKVWIEKNVQAGSFIVLEHYGPELFATRDLATLDDATRNRIIERTDSPVYAVQSIPMVQTMPERSDPFYDLSLYRIADYVITSGAVRTRYSEDPIRFRSQAEFYDSLETEFKLVDVIQPKGKPGPTLSIYKNPLQHTPFARRGAVVGPKELRPTKQESSKKEGLFYYNLGINYEMSGYIPEALASYDIGLRYYALSRPVIQRQLVVRTVGCLVALGRGNDALALLDRVGAASRTRQDREAVEYMRRWVREKMAQ